jgi:hypothetical protein
MAEETLRFLAKNQGFIVKEIFCGNNIGGITPCFNEAYFSNAAEMNDAYTSDAYITIVIQKEDYEEVHPRISDQELELYNKIIANALQYEHYVE